MIELKDVLEFLIRNGPGRTEEQLARAIYREGGHEHGYVFSNAVDALVEEGRILKRADGGYVLPLGLKRVG